jgi:type I restriction enzyme S subunit
MAVSQDYVTWTCGPNLDSWYLYYVLQSRKQEFSRIGFGNTIKTIGLDYFQHMTVPLPPLGEQQAVSGCLRDADRLVELLSQLIAKKRALKQGMMQELFTGRTRLPGFTSEWKPLTLGSAGSTYSGLVGKSGKDFGHGRGRFITFVEVMRDARLHGVELAQVDVKHGERQNNVRRGDVLFNGSSETPEEVALAAAVQFDKTDIFLNSFCFGYRLSRLGVVDPLFLAYFFRATPGRNLIISLAQGSTRYNIAKTKLMKTAVKLPEFAEQQAIASLIRDADAEIEALERRLEATRAIKQGMMQELLTGRTRLVAEGTA